MGDTNKSKRTNKHTKHKPRLNMHTQKHTRPNRAVWTGPGSCAHGKLPMYSVKCQGPLQLLSPPFLVLQHHETDAAKLKGGLTSPRGHRDQQHYLCCENYRVHYDYPQCFDTGPLRPSCIFTSVSDESIIWVENPVSKPILRLTLV